MTMVRIMSVCAQSSCAIRYYPDKKLGGTALVPPLYKTCWFFLSSFITANLNQL